MNTKYKNIHLIWPMENGYNFVDGFSLGCVIDGERVKENE